jgi:excisionase family DNA binding protein
VRILLRVVPVAKGAEAREWRTAVTQPTDKPAGRGNPSTPSMEELIEAAVERAMGRALSHYIVRAGRPSPAVYTVSQAAEVLQVSEDTVGRMVRRGVLPRVPYVGGKVLIPRQALDRMTRVPQEPEEPEEDSASSDEPQSKRSIISAARRSEPGMKCL